MVVVLAVGAADQRGGHAGDGGDLLVAGGDVGNDLLGGEGVVVVVVVGVVLYLVACVVEGFHGFRILFHPVPHHEKGGFYIVLRQNVDELLGILVAPW